MDVLAVHASTSRMDFLGTCKPGNGAGVVIRPGDLRLIKKRMRHLRELARRMTS